MAQPAVSQNPVMYAAVEERAQFIVRTYAHLLGAILGFVGIEMYLFSSGLAMPIAAWMFQFSWLIILGVFMLVSWVASRVAHQVDSVPLQYAALAGFVIAEAIIFVPLLVAAAIQSPDIIKSAAQVTILGFIGLTAVAFYTRKDFSFLRSFLAWGFLVAIGLIVMGIVVGFELGTYFTIGMIGFAGAAILYDTSNVLHHYPADRHVGAALALFASVALMFWYVLRLFMARE